jgi:hypothetical protein
MSNWRDRTERDAMVRGKAYHKPTEITKPTIKTHFLSSDVLFPLILAILSLSLSLGVMANLIYETLKDGTSVKTVISGNPNRIDVEKELLKVTCEKDNEGTFVTYITNIDGANKRPFIKWNSEDRCKNISTKFNEQIKADQKEKSDTSLISPEEKRISPDTAIINHYRLIQSKQLDESWSNLATSFQGTDSTKELNKKVYKSWWNSVERVNIRSDKIMEETKVRAVVRVDLSYFMKNGKTIHDDKSYVSLIWDNERWLIDNKSTVYTSSK